jgi:hypothetical protein
MEISRRLADRGECSSSKENAEVWKIIWNVEGPGALRHFLWKLYAGALPTKDNLRRRHIVSDPLCPFCSSCLEDSWHALWSCLVVRRFLTLRGNEFHANYKRPNFHFLSFSLILK